MIPKPPLWEHYCPQDRDAWYEEQIAKIDAAQRDLCVMSHNIAIERAAKVARSYEPKCDACPSGVTLAILKLKERRG